MEEALKLTPEVIAHQKVPGEFSDDYIFLRMKQWIEGDKGFTYSHVLSRFKTFPTRALWLMHKFYSENPHLNLRRAWMVFPEGKEQIEEDGSVTELTGHLATDSEVAKMEEDGKEIKKRLFSVHPATLDTLENIEYFNFERMEVGGPARVKRLSNVELKAIKKEAEERKHEQAMKINELFNKECERPKHASPGKKKKNEIPPKSEEEFFSPPPKRKSKSAEKESPPKNRRRINFTKDEEASKSGVKMNDVFTTGEEDYNMNMEEDIEETPEEEVPKKKKGSQKKSQRAANPREEADDDAKMEVEEDEDEAGPSNEPPRKIKELRTVQETTRDDEGFLVTSTQKKMVETDKIAPKQKPKEKKKATPSTVPGAAVPKIKLPGAKQQTTLTDFFKKK